jgi:hypothetical protein
MRGRSSRSEHHTTDPYSSLTSKPGGYTLQFPAAAPSTSSVFSELIINRNYIEFVIKSKGIESAF